MIGCCDTRRCDLLRPPACPSCGLVESAIATKRHTCNPTHVQMQKIGQAGVERIATAIVAAFRVFVPHNPLDSQHGNG